jgi:hypothetical protein
MRLLAMRLKERLQTYSRCDPTSICRPISQKFPRWRRSRALRCPTTLAGSGRDIAVQWAISADALRAHEKFGVTSPFETSFSSLRRDSSGNEMAIASNGRTIWLIRDRG